MAPTPNDTAAAAKQARVEVPVGLDNDHVLGVIDLYKQLNVPYKPWVHEEEEEDHSGLTLPKPQFECPRPPLRMATFPPDIRQPPPPALELFDLDECFTDVVDDVIIPEEHGEASVRSIDDAAKNPKDIQRWIDNIKEAAAAAGRPGTAVTYTGLRDTYTGRPGTADMERPDTAEAIRRVMAIEAKGGSGAYNEAKGIRK
jgi:hypothetical protein